MQDNSTASTATFYPFPRLPLELRVQIWGCVTKTRVLNVRKKWSPRRDSLSRRQGYWSPTPVPAVTRACQESREHCIYQKAFIINTSPRYIWTTFDYDVIQIETPLLFEDIFLDRAKVRHFRIDLSHDQVLHAAYFHYNELHHLQDISKLQSFELLVDHELFPQYTDFIRDTDWGSCPRGNVRVVDVKTGEWIDEETSQMYQDYLDTNGGEIVDQMRSSDGISSKEDRMEAMKKLQMPLPRIDLDCSLY